ncbi:sulfatase family protein [Algoriphagus zhangzhouensis]|uniref:Sulfatase n=1 Tax=Algoriphagus zhangzhouensis TaxID=1073327 RepID=A0A1M7Z7Z2_9BACT|nr:sulfatase [Algoriphagus zhangzhouensis]TDY49469.1 arylsulfatase A-like enzyme [Algoriphagus zhangzhouensis]SHO60989.1 Sulfatase [Algoriphagus zhangzhouensis]
MNHFKPEFFFLLLMCFWNWGSFAQTEKPNIIYIISDDQGWTDFGFMGHPQIETPNIDRLANESLTFTRGYVTAPLCSPSLATLITGLYPQQTKITGNDPLFESKERRYSPEWQLERSKEYQAFLNEFQKRPTIPQILGKAGYLSLQTGKWWGKSWKDAGFTHGMTHGDAATGGRHGDAGLAIGREGMKPIYDFIQLAEKEKKPFMVWYAPFLPHSPHTPPDSLLQKYLPKAPTEAIAKYWAMCEWLDLTVGELMDYLKQESLDENTLLIFVTDNGWIQNPDKTNQFMPGSKQDPADFGIRTPIMFHWPGKIAPKMDTIHLVSSVDIPTTTLAVAGLEGATPMEGIDVLDQAALDSRKSIYAVDFSHDMVDVFAPEKSLEHRVIISGDWKLILAEPEQGESVQLYQIIKDPFEKTNVAKQNPDVVKKLTQELEDWWERTNQ